jgi:DNA-binding IclR family transcriptional regulator
MNNEPRAATLTKAIDVLMTLLSGPKPLAAISKQTGLPKPTVHRLLEGLAYKDLVIQTDSEGIYGLGPGCLQLVDSATKDGGGLSGVAMPVLEELWRDTNETVALHVRVGLQRVCVAELISEGPLRYVSGVGTSAPIHVGSAGKVLLAFLPLAEQRVILSELPLQAVSPTSITDPVLLQKELAQVKKQGWASSFGERVPGAGAFSAPIFAGKNKLLAALSLLGPAERFGPDREHRLRTSCVRAASEISALMKDRLTS